MLWTGRPLEICEGVTDGLERRLRVGVIFGGRSGEHEVSLMSAESIMRALDPERYDVIPIGITKEGKWLIGSDPLGALREGVQRSIPAYLTPSQLIADPQDPGLVPLERSGGAASQRIGVDVFFPVLHGPYGEDGTVQGLLELAGVPYVGSGVAASAVGMDKALMRRIFQAHGLPLLDWRLVLRSRFEADPRGVAAEVAEAIGFPCFVKPANLGSSVGVTKVRRFEELDAALREAARFDRKILVEKAAVGYREVECSVLGNDEPVASIAGEIVPGGEFYDYRAKYLDDSSELIIPARISENAMREVQRLSIAAFKAIDAAGLARVDFFVHPETEEILVNEINTMPGFTRISMYPKLWEASGLSYRELVDRLIALALERHRDRQRSETSYHR